MWPGHCELWRKQLGKPPSSRSLDWVWEVTGPTTGSWGHFLLIFIQRPLTPRPPFPRGHACPLINVLWSVPRLHKPPPPACRLQAAPLGHCPVQGSPCGPPSICAAPGSGSITVPTSQVRPEVQCLARTRRSPQPALGQRGSRPGRPAQTCFRVTLRRAGLGRPRITVPEPGRSSAARSHRG